MNEIISDAHYLMKVTSEVNEICQPLIDSINLNYFAYMRQFDNGSCYILSSKGELIDYHLGKRYLCYPKIPKNLLRDKFPYIVSPDLDDGFNLPAYDYKVLFNIHFPIYLFEGYEDYFDLYIYGVQDSKSVSFNNYLSNLELLEKFKDYFKFKADPLINKAKANKIIIPSDMLSNFGGLCYGDEKSKSKDLKNILDPIASFKLTTRQSEVLKLFGRGYTAKEVAKVLDLSPRTVEFYLNEIKIKTGIHKKSHLISWCFDSGILSASSHD